MNASHTPGDWKYEPSTRTIRSAKENYWIATMDSWDGAVDHAANARLIARAPIMHDALRQISDLAGMEVLSGNSESDAMAANLEDISRNLGRIQAIIQNATA